jgi:hypothetical protein
MWFHYCIVYGVITYTLTPIQNLVSIHWVMKWTEKISSSLSACDKKLKIATWVLLPLNFLLQYVYFSIIVCILFIGMSW